MAGKSPIRIVRRCSQAIKCYKPLFFLDFPMIFHGFYHSNLHFPMVFLWFSYGFSSQTLEDTLPTTAPERFHHGANTLSRPRCAMPSWRCSMPSSLAWNRWKPWWSPKNPMYLYIYIYIYCIIINMYIGYMIIYVYSIYVYRIYDYICI